MSLFSFGKKSHRKIYIIFNIGSDSVSYAITKIRDNKTPKILFAGSKQIAFREELNFDSFLKGASSALKEACQDLERNGFLHLNFSGDRREGISNIHFFLSSPWVISKTRAIKFSKGKDFSVDEKLLKDIFLKEERKFEEENLNKKIIPEDDSFSLIENKIVSLKINGYRIEKVLGKKAKELELFLYQSLASKKAVSEFRRVVEESFHFSGKFSFHSWGYSAFNAMFAVFGLSDFMLIDITGEITDIIIAKDSVLKETISVPYAKNSIIKSLSNKMETNNEEITSRLRMLAGGKASDIEKIKVDTFIGQIGVKWVEEMKKILLDIPEEFSLKDKFFLISDKELAPYFKKFLKDQIFPSLNLEKVEPLDVDSDFFKKSVDTPVGQTDPFLLMESIYLKDLSAHTK